MTSTTAFIKSRRPSRIWTCPTLPLMSKAKLQPVLLNSKEPTSYSLMISTLTLKVMGRPLTLIKGNLSRTVFVNLKRIRRLRRRKKRPPSSSSSFFTFLFTCILLTFGHLREQYLFLPSPIFFGFFKCKHLPFIGFLFIISYFVRCLNIYIYIYCISICLS